MKEKVMAERLPPMTNAEYHALDGLSNSQLSDFAKSPAYYHAVHVEKSIKKKPATDDMLIGTALHEVLLEGGPQSFVPMEEPLDLRTKAGKEQAARIEEEHPGKAILRVDDWQQVCRMQKAALEHPAARRFLFDCDGENEIGYVFHDVFHGVRRRCKVDRVINGGRFIVDIKTCNDAGPEAFAKTVLQREYHRQAAFYRDIVAKAEQTDFAPQFFFIAISKEEVPRVELYRMLDDFLDIGQSRLENLLSDFAACNRSGNWNFKHFGEVLSLPVPRYAKYQGEFEIA